VESQPTQPYVGSLPDDEQNSGNGYGLDHVCCAISVGARTDSSGRASASRPRSAAHRVVVLTARLSPIRATQTWRAAVDPTTSAFHLDPGAFFAQKRHIRLAWNHCKPSRLSSYLAMSRFRWPGYRFGTRWPPVGHIDAHSRWQMSLYTARRALVAPSAAPAACSQVIRATCQRRARRASARHATWPQEAALAASLAPGQVCDPRPVPARSLRWPPWSPGTHAQYPTSLAHLRCRLSSGPHC
jgi:hypothetical protein